MKKIGVIINPNARYIKKLKQDPVSYFGNIAGDIADVRATQTIEEVDSIAEEYKESGIPYLAICGGDGTHHHVMSRFINVYGDTPTPPILHLRAGTMNTGPRTINLKGKPEKLLQKLSRAVREGREIETHRRDTIKVDDKYCVLFGVGMTANFLYEYYQGESTGPIRAVQTILTAVKGAFFKSDVGTLYDRVKARVIVDGEEIPHDDFLLILCATVSDIGIGFKAMYRAYEKEGAFHVVSAGCDRKDVVKHLPGIRTGKPMDHPHFYDHVAQKVSIISAEKLLYTMDGDLYEAEGELVAEIGQPIRMIYI